MENPGISLENIGKKFATPQEELEFLREKIAKQEQVGRPTSNQMSNQFEQVPIEESISRENISRQIYEYKKEEPEAVLEESYRLPEKETGEIVLKLSPEEHDNKMAELLGILQEKGIRNTLSIVAKMRDAHIEDDFHRFLVEYIKEGFNPAGIKEKSPLWKQLHMTLFEIALPTQSADGKEKEKPLKELISSMEQLYSGMLSISGKKKNEKNHLAFEIAVSEKTEDAIFYVAVPDGRKDLFEKQVLSIFPQAKVFENKDDYNIFNEKGVSVGAYGKVKRNKIFPLKTYDVFDYDPLNILLSAFSKLEKNGEGAAVQIIFSPSGDSYNKKYKYALDRIQKGTSVGEATNMPETLAGGVFKEVKSFFGNGSLKKKDKNNTPPIIDQIAIEQITNKISSPIVESNIRIVASAETKERADAILSDIEAVFNQFEESQGNAIAFKHLKKRALGALLRDFSYRRFIYDQKIPLNLKEITTLYHFPSSGISSSRELKQSKAGTAPAPLGMPESGVLLGINKYRNSDTEVHITREDRLRHFYTIGQTGTGKSVLLKNMALQDIQNGDGVCVIDPHGVDINDILGAVPEHRMKDVIYFDPGYTARPSALNMLEYDERYPEQKTFVVNEMLSIFNKLFDMQTAGGPMFEQYFRNATMLVIEDPSSGNTLLDVSRVLADENFRKMKLSKCNNPIITQFWQNIAEKAKGDLDLANIVPYITNKFDVFMANDIMRPIIAQSKSSFNFRQIMDEKKILLVNLAKGRLGDINAHLIGLILVGKILMATLSRVDDIQNGGQNAPDFYLYLDEFQNITTDSISTILSEARKYKLGLSVAHQFIAQLDDKIKDAVFGNVGSICAFRVGVDDAEYLKNQFEPVFSANDLMNIDNYNAYLKMLVDGRPVKPFNIETLPPAQANPKIAENLKQLSHLTYGRDRDEVEEEIRARYNKE
jgi:hypothetical protein